MKWMNPDTVSSRGHPPLSPFSYGNPSSSSELLGSSINQRLYEIPAGAKGQRRKLAAVLSSPFMLAARLITKCTISLISTLKQSPRQAGEELFAHSYILWHRILFWGGGRGSGWYSSPPRFLSTLSFCTPFFHRLQVWEGKQWSMLPSHCFVDTCQQRLRSNRWLAASSLSSSMRCYLLMQYLVDCFDLFTSTIFIILLYYCQD